MKNSNHTSSPGLRFREWPAGHPIIVKDRDALEAMILWLESNVTLAARPLASLSADPDDNSMREALGHSSFDSLALALHRKAALYADDLGLRRFALSSGVASFSTASLLIGLAEGSAITSADAGQHLLSLVQMRYARVPMSQDLIRRMIQSMDSNRLAGALGANLGPPAFSPQAAGRLCAKALKWAATEAILMQSLAILTTAILNGMASHWPKPLCGYALLRGAIEEMSLLPRQLDIVKTTCRDFSKSDSNLIGRGH